MFPSRKASVNFTPDRDIPSLNSKVIFVTGGTAGIGRATVEALAKHSPAHIYFSGRNKKAADSLIANVKQATPSASLTFLEIDLASLASVKNAVTTKFIHDRLDVLICNAGIMGTQPGVSKDGYEIQFATNHLGHAMLIHQLMPIMLKTADSPAGDVRIVILSSVGYRGHPKQGIAYSTIQTSQEKFFGRWINYGQSKLANILYATELAKQYPNITTVSIHPGVVDTGLVTNMAFMDRALVYVPNWLMNVPIFGAEEGSYNQLWAAVGAKKSDLVNGAFYLPVGIMATDKLDKAARDEKLAKELWTWTEKVLAQH